MNLNAVEYKATVKIDVVKTNTKPLTNKMFGIFSELILDYVNGSKGLWAEELYDRGFDMDTCDVHNHPCLWGEFRSSDSSELRLVHGGSNPNGIYGQQLINHTDTSVCGVSQQFIASDTVGYFFSLHYRGTGGRLAIQLVSDNYIDCYVATLGEPKAEWNKVKVEIPPIPNWGKLTLRILYAGKGECEIDEASLMQTNNFMGIRNEYYRLLKNWNIGIWRYPGGYFADRSLSRWKLGIGDPDTRVAPNYNLFLGYQRLDFGTIEYINLCKALKIEPHICVNFESGTKEEAADWVEFCNGDTNTVWGKKRAELGYPTPFGVKYWEIGNEQWTDPQGYANGYIPFYDAMKKVDPTIRCISDGNVWDGTTLPIFFKTFKDKFDIYGYHDFLAGQGDGDKTDEARYLRIMASPTPVENNLISMNNQLKENNLYPQSSIANTEWSTLYQGWPASLYDTSVVSRTLETGISNAAWYHVYMRNPDLIDFTERIIGIVTIKREINSHGRRSIYGSCAYLAAVMESNHFGENVAHTQVDAPDYDQIWYRSPFIDVTTTYTNDSIFISIINKHLTDDVNISFQLDTSLFGRQIKYYQLNSPNYSDTISADNPFAITIKTYDKTFNSSMVFPPHSLTILAISRTLAGVIQPKQTNDIEVRSFSNGFSITSSDYSGLIKLKFFDFSGKLINSDIIYLTRDQAYFSNSEFLSNGIYLVELTDDSSVVRRFKILISH